MSFVFITFEKESCLEHRALNGWNQVGINSIDFIFIEQSLTLVECQDTFRLGMYSNSLQGLTLEESSIRNVGMELRWNSQIYL